MINNYLGNGEIFKIGFQAWLDQQQQEMLGQMMPQAEQPVTMMQVADDTQVAQMQDGWT